MQKIISDLNGNVHLKANDGFLPLHIAVMNNHVELIEFLIAECEADVTMLLDESGFSLLHLAVISNAYSSIYCLLDLGADAFIKDRNGRTALYLAVQYQKIESAVVLSKMAPTNLETNRPCYMTSDATHTSGEFL